MAITLSILSLLLFHNGFYEWKGREAPPGFSHVDYEGLYVLDGNNRTIVEGRFVIFGSLLVKDNATLVVRGELSIYYSSSNSPVIRDHGKLIVENGGIDAWIWGWQDHGWETVTGVGSLSLTDQAECNISISKFYALSISVGQNARLQAHDSHLDGLYVAGNTALENCNVEWVESKDNSLLSVKNSTIDTILCEADHHGSMISIQNSSLNTFSVGLNSTISVNNSAIEWVELSQGSFSIVYVENSKIGLSLDLIEKNLIWTVKPFFAGCWNIHKDLPLHMANGNLTLENTNVTKIAVRFVDSSVSLVNSKLYGLGCAGTRLYILGCSIDGYLRILHSSVYSFDSTFERLYCYDSNTTLVNSVCPQIDVGVTGVVEVWWNLEVIITDKAENPKQDATVSVYSPDLELVEKKPVTEDGMAQFTLLGKRITWNKTENLGNYVIHAEYGEFFIDKNIILDKSKEISLTVVPFIVLLTRFLTSPLGIIILVALATISVVVVFKWKKRVQKPKVDIAQYAKI